MQSRTPSWEPKILPHDYSPRDIDILCGRGKGSWDHEGNKSFRMVVARHAQRYALARNKLAKTELVASVVDMIREEGILFVKLDRDKKQWHEIGRREAKKKTGHAIRDHLAKFGGIISDEKSVSLPNSTESSEAVEEGTRRASLPQATNCDSLKNDPSKIDPFSQKRLMNFVASQNKPFSSHLGSLPSLLRSNKIPQQFPCQDVTEDGQLSQKASKVLWNPNDFEEELYLEDYDDTSIASCSSLSI